MEGGLIIVPVCGATPGQAGINLTMHTASLFSTPYGTSRITGEHDTRRLLLLPARPAFQASARLSHPFQFTFCLDDSVHYWRRAPGGRLIFCQLRWLRYGTGRASTRVRVKIAYGCHARRLTGMWFSRSPVRLGLRDSQTNMDWRTSYGQLATPQIVGAVRPSRSVFNAGRAARFHCCSANRCRAWSADGFAGLDHLRAHRPLAFESGGMVRTLAVPG